jgi:hypothetical protein
MELGGRIIDRLHDVVDEVFDLPLLRADKRGARSSRRLDDERVVRASRQLHDQPNNADRHQHDCTDLHAVQNSDV